MKKILLATLVVASLFTSCKEHFSDGERVASEEQRRILSSIPSWKS